MYIYIYIYIYILYQLLGKTRGVSAVTLVEVNVFFYLGKTGGVSPHTLVDVTDKLHCFMGVEVPILVRVQPIESLN